MTETDTIIEIVNFVGGIILASLWLPQMYKAKRTKKTDDISIVVLCINIIGASCIEVYSAYFDIKSFLIPNSIGLGFCIIMTITKIYYDRKNKKIPIDIVTESTPVDYQSQPTQPTQPIQITQTTQSITNTPTNLQSQYDNIPDTIITIINHDNI